MSDKRATRHRIYEVPAPPAPRHSNHRTEGFPQRRRRRRAHLGVISLPREPLRVYYGAADTSGCLATGKLSKIVEPCLKGL